ncbi:MAG: hypothetical protein DVB23_003282 [Verrucomicrobia bacterium]|nr:MAG: hypothetical protein DVB23_003282 [Verrucomicrobiota bacterium]
MSRANGLDFDRQVSPHPDVCQGARHGVKLRCREIWDLRGTRQEGRLASRGSESSGKAGEAWQGSPAAANATLGPRLQAPKIRGASRFRAQAGSEEKLLRRGVNRFKWAFTAVCLAVSG